MQYESRHARRRLAHAARRLGVLLVLAPAAAHAQERMNPSLFVTAIAGAGTPRTTLPSRAGQPAAARPLRSDQALVDGQQLELAANQQVMLYSPPPAANRGEAVVMLIGPARLTVRLSRTRIALELAAGQCVAVVPAAASPSIVSLVAPGAAGANALFEGLLAPGTAYVARSDAELFVGYEAAEGAAASWAVAAPGAEAGVPSGRRLILRGGRSELAELSPWLAQSGLGMVHMGQTLGVASARSRRLEVNDLLFKNLYEWDRKAAPPNVIVSLALPAPKFDIRQTTATVTTQLPNTQAAQANFASTQFRGANQVSVISPAAISVGGVTAVNIANLAAGNLLTLTGSRGLGFNGLAQLAIQGIIGGQRTAGPSGIAAPRTK